MEHRAFTLVELLIVVMILGILAAVVIPQFSDASTDARLSSLVTNLQTIRSQIELYRLQHDGLGPTNATGFPDQMTKKTDADGTVNPVGEFGPYLQRIPRNPFSNSINVSNGTPGPSKGWYYNGGTGEFRANDGGATDGVAHDML